MDRPVPVHPETQRPDQGRQWPDHRLPRLEGCEISMLKPFGNQCEQTGRTGHGGRRIRTVLCPDVVVLPSSVVDDPDHTVTADDVALVAEIAWPSAARMDWWLKPRLYADVRVAA